MQKSIVVPQYAALLLPQFFSTDDHACCAIFVTAPQTLVLHDGLTADAHCFIFADGNDDSAAANACVKLASIHGTCVLAVAVRLDVLLLS